MRSEREPGGDERDHAGVDGGPQAELVQAADPGLLRVEQDQQHAERGDPFGGRDEAATCERDRQQERDHGQRREDQRAEFAGQ
jgi:hypothetical protein